MKICLVIALAGATFASEDALDSPDKIKDKKLEKYSQIVPSEGFENVLKNPAADFSLEAEPAAVAAEANADPWYGYYGYGLNRPYGYGYYGYRPYGYGYYYGKRSADAEPTAEAAASPEAEADPWYGYYGYGLHRPYGYGYYGYRPYGYGYYYGKRS